VEFSTALQFSLKELGGVSTKKVQNTYKGERREGREGEEPIQRIF